MLTRSGKQVGYIRLRHGKLTVECPDCGDTLVFTGEPNGSGGEFLDDERVMWLNKCLTAIKKWMNQ